MKIVETRIPDVTSANIDEAKVTLSENIIKNVYPLFDGVYSDKAERLESLKKQVIIKNKELRQGKAVMQSLVDEYNRKKKVSKLLDRLNTLIESGLMYDGTMKHETIILLKIIDKLPIEKLNEQLAKSMQILNKRFSSV